MAEECDPVAQLRNKKTQDMHVNAPIYYAY